MASPKFHDVSFLLDRLVAGSAHKGRPVVFLIGAPLSSPMRPGEPGIPGVSEMLDLIGLELSANNDPADPFRAAIRQSDSPYQAAFEQLLARRGQDAANNLIRESVLRARQDYRESVSRSSDSSWCEGLMNDIDGWVLPTGLRSLGRIVTQHPQIFGQAVLTSNFDPLTEVSIRRSGGSCYRTTLHRDGDLSQTSADGCHVVHFHGFWVGRDTLHTAMQLKQDRPRLKQSLRSLLGNSTVMVLGYGGWDDILTQSLMEIVADDNATPDILWTFLENDEAKILNSKAKLLSLLDPGLSRGRVNLYRGIDCNTFLPSLVQELSDERTRTTVPLGVATQGRLVEVTDRGSQLSHMELRIQIPARPVVGSNENNPPEVYEWVGRDDELNLLRREESPVVTITGIGGQGKSALAAQYLRAASERGDYENWDWRDCKEESDRINTQLCRAIAKISDCALEAAALENSNTKSLVEVLFDTIGSRRWLFVFDNVDQYIDLEKGQFISGVAVLFEAALSRSHKSRFIFTCRPEVVAESSRVLRLALSGLSLSQTTELFRRHGVSIDETNEIKDAYELTKGHPMWINMISMQVVRRQRKLQDVLREIRRGAGELPEKTLRSIWGTLNKDQKTLLRTLAELERAESPERLADIVETMAPNRFSKALRTSRALQLIVVKVGAGRAEVLELHPLVKSFIQKEFARKDRDQVISRIITFLDRMIGKYKGSLSTSPSIEILEHWTQKAELDISRKRFESATETILEVASPLRERGYSEELVRIGKRLLIEVEWGVASVDYKGFDEVVRQVLEVMIQFGQYSEAESFLEKYSSAIPGKSAQYINLCDLRCYLYWFQEKFGDAIYWGEEGEVLASTNVDTKYSTAHNLALSRRDSGKIQQALEHFLGGKVLDEVLGGVLEREKGGSFYGNIGRCLQLDGRLDDALCAYRKSAICLDMDRTGWGKINRGYVRFWLGEVLLNKQSKDLAMTFLRAAHMQWKEVAPARARKVELMIKDLDSTISLPETPDSSDKSEAERIVRNWLNS